MWKLAALCLLTVACPYALALNCGDVVNVNKSTTEGSFSGPPTSFTPNTACNVTISLHGQSQITAQVINVRVAPGDSLMVYDGKNGRLADFTAKSVAETVLIGFRANMTFVFKSAGKVTTTSWSVNFNTEVCAVSSQKTGVTSVTSPVYLKTAKKITVDCVYTVTTFLPAEYVAAFAFTGFQLVGQSKLTIEGAQGEHSYTAGSPLTDFFTQGDDPVQLNMTIVDTRSSQNFSLAMEPVLKDCSGRAEVNGTLKVSKVISAQRSPSMCRWVVMSSERPLLHAQVTGLQLAPTGGDSLSFRQGGSSRAGAALDTVRNNVEDYLVVTSTNTMVVTLTLGVAQADRMLNLTFMDADVGGRMEGEGYLFTHGTAETEIFFSLVASPGRWVDVSSMTNLTDGSTVQFYDGPQKSSPLLAVWSEADQALTPVTGQEQMLVVVSHLVDKENFNASFKSVPAGCDSLTSASSGERTFSASSPLKKDQTCTWTVAPLDTEGTVVISLSSLNLREKESLTLTSGVESSGQVLAKFTGPHLQQGGYPVPQVYVPVAERFRVTYTRVADASTFIGAQVQYRLVPQACGGELKGPMGVIQTPNYPNQYPLNAACDWTFGSSGDVSATPSSFLLLSFSSLSLAQDHSISVLQHQGNKSVAVATYGGMSMSASKLPVDLILPGAADLTVAFSSEPTPGKVMPANADQVSGGASLNYWILECGGNVTTANGSFTSPEFSKPPTKSAFCVWILNVADVKGPDNSTNILAFNLTADGKDAKSIGHYLRIYDGPTLRSPNFPLSYNLSRYASIVVVFNLTISDSHKPDVSFKFDYNTKTCDKNHQCANGICMHQDWICNGHDDCGDNSDERNCVIPPPTPKPNQPADYSGYVKAGWVAGCLFIGLALGAGLVLLIPRIVRRFRGRSGSYNRMEEPVV